jgi:hypothetical protein
MTKPRTFTRHFGSLLRLVQRHEGWFRKWLVAGCVVVGTILAVLRVPSIDESLQRLSMRNLAVLDHSAALSRDLWDRGYLVDSFAANATCTVKEEALPVLGPNASRGVLTVTCQKAQSGDAEHGIVFAGINIFGNEFVAGRFRPLSLSRDQQVRFRFRYPCNGGLFVLKLKNGAGFETSGIPITAEGGRGEFQTFVLPMTDRRVEGLFGDSDAAEFLVNIAILTEFEGWGSTAEIELSSFVFEQACIHMLGDRLTRRGGPRSDGWRWPRGMGRIGPIGHTDGPAGEVVGASPERQHVDSSARQSDRVSG